MKQVILFVVFVNLVIGEKFDFDLSTGKCEGSGKCVIQSDCGIDGTDCLILSANSSSKSLGFRSPTIPGLLPGGSIWLVVHLHCEGKSINPKFGLASNSVSASKTFQSSINGSWIKYEALFKRGSYGTESSIYLTIVGQIGICHFSKISASPAKVKEVSFPTFGPLSHNERILEDGTYINSVGGIRAVLTNHQRTLVDEVSAFSENTFILHEKGFLVFNHSLNVPFLSNPTLAATLFGYGTAFMAIESSNDGNNWVLVKNVSLPSSASKFNWTLSSLDPLIRFTSYGLYGYLSSYSFTSTVAAPGIVIIGREIVLIEDFKNANNTSISLSEPINSDNFNQIIQFNVKSAQISQLKLSVTPNFLRSSMNFIPSNSVISNLTYHLAGGIPQQASWTITSLNSVISKGRIWFWPSHFYLDSSFGFLIASSSPTTSLWWCDGTHQIYQHRAVPERLQPIIEINAARNEREPFQLVVNSKTSTPITINSISITDLISSAGEKFSKSDISIRQVSYVTTQVLPESGNDQAILKTAWPDALLPLNIPFVCKSGLNCPFWFLIYVGANIIEGSYSGNISLSTSSETLSVVLNLRVWNFSIPKHSKFTSFFRIQPTNIWTYHNISNSANRAATAQRENQWNLYLKSLEEHRLSPHNPMSFYNPYGKIVMVNGTEHWNFDGFVPFENNYKRFFDDSDGMGFTHFSAVLMGLPTGNRNGITNGAISGLNGRVYLWNTTNHTRLFKEYAIALQNLLERTGIIEKTTIYWFDEPLVENYPIVKSISNTIHSVVPKMKIMLTEQAEEELVGDINVWCGSIPLMNVSLSKQRQTFGEKIWTYSGFKFWIDGNIVETRIWMWLNYKWSIDGILMWHINLWNSYSGTTLQDPYEDPTCWDGTRNLGNCEGRWYYPPANWKKAVTSLYNSTPIETIRLENMREGLEDWEYFKAIENVISKRQNLPNELKLRARALLQIPESILVDYTPVQDPEEMMEIRIKIANILEEIAITQDDNSQSNKQDSTSNNRHEFTSMSSIITFNLLLFIIIFVFVLF